MKLGLILFLFMFCNVRGQIIRGQIATPAQFPYVVQVHRKFPRTDPDFVNREFLNPSHKATGVIIGKKFVLTAAHVVRREIEDENGQKTGQWETCPQVWVVGGDLHLEYCPFNPIVREAVDIEAHDGYDRNPDIYDIALLHLKNPFPLDYGSGINSIEIGTNDPALGYECKVMGWGNTDW